MVSRISNENKQKRGFTLIEVVAALGVLMILSTSIIMIFSSTVDVSRTLIKNQEKDLYTNDFDNFIEQIFHNLPKRSSVTLELDSNSIQTLTIYDAELSFPLSGQDQLAKVSQLKSTLNRSGIIDLILTHQLSNNELSSAADIDYQLNLIQDLTQLEWQFYYTETNDWRTTWKRNMGLPKLIKLKYTLASQNYSTQSLIKVLK